MSGKANDAVSAYTQGNMREALKLLKLLEAGCPTVWIRLPRNRHPKRWDTIEDPMVRLERNPYGHRLVGLLWERRYEEV